jgi:hypothetical protein
MRRTRDVFPYVPETRQKLGMLLLGGTGDAASTPNLPDELTIPPLSIWMLDFNDITRRPTNILQEKEKARDWKQCVQSLEHEFEIRQSKVRVRTGSPANEQPGILR